MKRIQYIIIQSIARTFDIIKNKLSQIILTLISLA